VEGEGGWAAGGDRETLPRPGLSMAA
jgi:hypothetical protein